MHLITEADVICISMHSQQYDKHTYEAATDAIHPYYDAVWSDFDLIQFNTMRFKEKRCNGNKYDAMQFNIVQIVRFYFFGSL